MPSAANCRLALAPVAKPRAASAHDVTCMQPEDPSAPTASTADELQKDDARAHAHVGDANFA
jgi:hypothetical protein